MLDIAKIRVAKTISESLGNPWTNAPTGNSRRLCTVDAAAGELRLSITNSRIRILGHDAPPADARADVGIGAAALITIVFFLCAAMPIIVVQVPPLGDYVNHLARMYVIAEAGRDPRLAQFYTIDWKLIPNLAMDLFVPPLVAAVGIYWAGKIFVLMSFALALSGAHAIHWTLFRRVSLGTSVAALFLYSDITSAGLVNYCFGIGLAMWGFAFWIALRERRPWLRIVVSALFVVVLFVCHLSALGLYGTALLGFELWRLRAEPAARQHLAAELAAFALPFFLIPALLAFGPRGVRSGGFEWQLFSKGQGLWYIVKTYYHAYDAAVAVALAAAAAWAWRRGALRFHPAGWAILLVSIPLFLALPYGAMTAVGVDKRFPVGVVLVLCGLIAWAIDGAPARRALIVVLSALLCLRIGGVAVAAGRVRSIVVDFQHSLAFVPPGSKIMVALTGTDIPFPETLLALPCLAIIERSSLVSNAFSDPAEQVLTVKPPYRAFTGGIGGNVPSVAELLDSRFSSSQAHSGRMYWRDWQQEYDYLYVISSGAEAPNPAPQSLAQLFASPHFQLYRISH